ncbi:MAG: hypothetical protein Q9M36_00885 [Sulfurovum sp.]|nr:hypothetical protein [Sulfurovum sp.]
MMSIALSLGFRSHIVLGHSQTSAHAWAEVALSKEKPSPKTLDTLLHFFGKYIAIYHRSNQYWLGFEKSQKLVPYKASYIILKSGQVQSVGF